MNPILIALTGSGLAILLRFILLIVLIRCIYNEVSEATALVRNSYKHHVFGDCLNAYPLALHIWILAGATYDVTKATINKVVLVHYLVIQYPHIARIFEEEAVANSVSLAVERHQSLKLPPNNKRQRQSPTSKAGQVSTSKHNDEDRADTYFLRNGRRPTRHSVGMALSQTHHVSKPEADNSGAVSSRTRSRCKENEGGHEAWTHWIEMDTAK